MGFKNLIILTVVGLAGIAFLGFSQAQELRDSDYGAFCNESAPPDYLRVCNASDYLVCNIFNQTTGDGICGCTAPMIRDHEINKCVVPAGNENATCLAHASDGKFPTPCTPGAYCLPLYLNGSAEGLCECRNGFAATPLGQCKLTHGFGNCSDHIDCNIYAFLTCGSTATCVCDQELATWDATKQQCVGLAGGSCTTTPGGRQCGANAVCNTTGICVCNAGFGETSDGQCLLSHNQTCTIDSECNPMFTCQGPVNATVCECPLNSNFEEETCKLLIGEVCNDQVQCVKFSSCTTDANNATTCQCDSNYSPTAERQCLADHGGQCSTVTECNPDKYLTCVNNATCGCANNYEFLDDRCQGYIEQPCADDNNCIGVSTCIDNQGTKTCRCPALSSASGDKQKCLWDHDQECSSERECNSEKFLACSSNSTCQCEDLTTMIFESTSALCVGKAGTPCGPDQSRNLGCVQFATCAANNCACISGYAPNNDLGTCVPAGGAAGNLQASLTFISLTMIFVAFSKSQ